MAADTVVTTGMLSGELGNILNFLAAAAGLGTAAMGVVDATKAFGGGPSNFGFARIKTGIEPFLVKAPGAVRGAERQHDAAVVDRAKLDAIRIGQGEHVHRIARGQHPEWRSSHAGRPRAPARRRVAWGTAQLTQQDCDGKEAGPLPHSEMAHEGPRRKLIVMAE